MLSNFIFVFAFATFCTFCAIGSLDRPTEDLCSTGTVSIQVGTNFRCERPFYDLGRSFSWRLQSNSITPLSKLDCKTEGAEDRVYGRFPAVKNCDVLAKTLESRSKGQISGSETCLAALNQLMLLQTQVSILSSYFL